MKGYCAWLKRYCTAFGVPYIDFCVDFLSPDGSIRSELLLDGLHPTPEGHRLMAAAERAAEKTRITALKKA